MTAPDGYYAVRYNGLVGFYRFKTSKDGRWAGRQWVDRFHSSLEGRITAVERDAVRAAVEADPVLAGAAFAQDMGCCYNCGRALTDETSRAYGIGPVCAGAGTWSAAQRIRIDGEKVEPPVAVKVERTGSGSASSSEAKKSEPAGTLTVKGDNAVLVSAYDAEAVDAARAIPGRRWDKANRWNWFPVNAATVPALRALCERFGYTIDGELPDVKAPEPAPVPEEPAYEEGTYTPEPETDDRAGVTTVVGPRPMNGKAADRARAMIERITANPAELEESFQARRDFGPSYGYKDGADWWDTMVRSYPGLFKGEDAPVRPAWLDSKDAVR
jgi:hypothetical protein